MPHYLTPGISHSSYPPDRALLHISLQRCVMRTVMGRVMLLLMIPAHMPHINFLHSCSPA
jgi:hypothetical protein